MPTRHPLLSLAAAAAAALSFTFAGCGGGNAEPPPDDTTTVVVPAVPVVTITNDVSAETATGDITFTFSFDVDVGTSFTADDVVVTGGTKGAFTRLGGSAATLVVVPPPDATGVVEIAVPAGAVSDATGAVNAAVGALKAYDTTKPVVRTTLVSFEEAPPPTLIGFGGAEGSTIVADPAAPANQVARVVKSAAAESWAGTTVAICPNQAIVRLPFSSTLTKMSARVWSPAAGVPVRLKVENAADGTQTVETEARTTVAGAWETLTFDFASPAAGTPALDPGRTYDKASIFFDFGTPGSATGERSYYFDDLAFVGSSFTVSCAGGSTVTKITMDEVPPPLLTGFGGAEDSTVVADPAGGTNKVARVAKSATAEVWAGTTVSTLPALKLPPVPFASGATTLTVRVWSPAAGVPVRLKVENAGDPTKSVETEATVTAANGWQTLSFDFARQVAGTAPLDLAATYDKLSIFFNFGTTGAATGARVYYFEDITYPGAGGGTPVATTKIDFESATPPALIGFGGAEDAAVQADPSDAGNKVARITKSATAESWAGTTIATGAGNTIDRIGFASGRTTITARVWSPVAGIPVRMKVENAANASVSVETEASVTTAGGWQTLSWDFATPASGTAALGFAAVYDRLSVFFDFGTTGAAAGAARTYYIDDIVYPAAGGGGGTASPLTFSSGYTAGGATAQGGSWGYFSGDFSSYLDTFTGGGFADSSPPVADDAQYFFIAVITSAPTQPTGTPPTSGGYLGMYVTHPGLTLGGQTTLAVNLGMDANFFKQTSKKDIDVFVVGATTYGNGSGGECRVTLKGSITPTTDAMITYTVPLASLALVQPCNGGGFNSGVTTAAQALAQPIGAVNTQFTFPNVNTTINSGTAGAPVYATGLTRGKTEFR